MVIFSEKSPEYFHTFFLERELSNLTICPIIFGKEHKGGPFGFFLGKPPRILSDFFLREGVVQSDNLSVNFLKTKT